MENNFVNETGVSSQQVEVLKSENASLAQKYAQLEDAHRQLIERHQQISARVAHMIGRLKVLQGSQVDEQR